MRTSFQWFSSLNEGDKFWCINLLLGISSKLIQILSFIDFHWNNRCELSENFQQKINCHFLVGKAEMYTLIRDSSGVHGAEQSESDLGAHCLWQNVHRPGSQGCCAWRLHRCASSSQQTWTAESGSPQGGPLSPVCSLAKTQTYTVRYVLPLNSQTFVVTRNYMTSLALTASYFWAGLKLYYLCGPGSICSDR